MLVKMLGVVGQDLMHVESVRDGGEVRQRMDLQNKGNEHHINNR